VAASAFVLTLAIVVISLYRQPLDLVVSLTGVVIAVIVAIAAILADGPTRKIAAIAAAVFAVIALSLLVSSGEGTAAVAVALLFAIAAEGVRRAVRALVRRPPAVRIVGARIGPCTHPVLLANPRSGGGTAERVALGDEARRRGIEYVVLGPGDDLRGRAEEAVQRGADVLGMAGGDGSQALVAEVALAHDLGFVCVPVGTRNHFAKDLGLDASDPVAALDAFGDAEEIRIDLGAVADRVFVNNVSFGVYAMIVGTEGYRENKPETAWQILPTVVGPDAGPIDLRFTGPDGREQTGFQHIAISNDPYHFTADSRFGSRERLDLGVLGIVAARAGKGDDFFAFATGWWAGPRDPSGGWLQWEAPEFEIGAAGPIPAGVDGEALVFDPPVRFRSLPGALRVRLPPTRRTGT
jgi:diacylglycerol kinase family enzyme